MDQCVFIRAVWFTQVYGHVRVPTYYLARTCYCALHINWITTIYFKFAFNSFWGLHKRYMLNNFVIIEFIFGWLNSSETNPWLPGKTIYEYFSFFFLIEFTALEYRGLSIFFRIEMAKIAERFFMDLTDGE